MKSYREFRKSAAGAVMAEVMSEGEENLPIPEVILNDKMEFESYPRESREIAYARMEVVKKWQEEKRTARAVGIKIEAIEKSFIYQLVAGEICAGVMSKLKKEGKISIRTIYRWEKALKDNESSYPIGLIDKIQVTKRDKETKYITSWIKMQAADPRGRTIADIKREAEEKIPGFDMSYRSVARIVEKTRKDKLLIAAMKGKTAFKNEARPHIRRINDCEPGEKWEGDGKVVNVLVMSPFWFHNDKSMRYLIRPVLVCWIDVATWMITGWATWLSESWHLVRTSFIDGVSKCGIPQIVTYDGGGSFFNIWTDPEEFAGRKRETATVKKARELIRKGYKGFYQQLGVEKQVKTIAGNSESKQIEPAWGDIFGDWEKRQFAYVGKDFQARPEWMRMTNIKLMKTYKDKIMTWDEYVNSIDAYIREWNNRPRESLRKLDGSQASAIEVYNEFKDKIKKPKKEEIEHICWHPRKAIVQRDGIYLDGLLYHHPAFGVYLGQSMLVEYDERNRFECNIATISGEKLAIPARLCIPGMHNDDEQSQKAMIDRARYEKELKAVYLERINGGEGMTMKEFNSITARVDMLLEDQKRRQEKEKDIGIEFEGKTQRRKKEYLEMEDGFESIEDEFINCPIKQEEKERDADDDIIDEISKELNNIGIRSTI